MNQHAEQILAIGLTNLYRTNQILLNGSGVSLGEDGDALLINQGNWHFKNVAQIADCS